MFALSAKDRCKKCNKERALRLCQRTGKQLCWRCCNALRIDLKCPESCPYTGKMVESSPIASFKADNFAETEDVIKRHIDLWIGAANPLTEGQSPLAFAQDQPEKMLKLLTGYQYPDYFPLDYFMQKLGLELSQAAPSPNPESLAAQYLEHIIALEYDKLVALTLGANAADEYKALYSQHFRSNPYLKKVHSFSPIHTGASEDGSQAIVFVELNYKTEWCLVLRKEAGNWYIRQNLNGNPSLYFSQNERYRQIANQLSEGKLPEAFMDISEALRSYIDSADLFYYRALCRLMQKEQKLAIEDFKLAIALDPLFSPAYMNLGILALNSKDYPAAIRYFSDIARLEPDNLDALNNLGIAYIALKQKDKAFDTWQAILKQKPDYELARKNLEHYQ